MSEKRLGDLFNNSMFLYSQNKKPPTNEDLKHWLEVNCQSEKVTLNPMGFLGFSGSSLGTGVNRKLS